MSSNSITIKVRAPINIALIKYWGKDDEEAMIPCNPSISLTIDSPELLSETWVTADPDLAADEFHLNEKESVIGKRMARVVEMARSLADNSHSSHPAVATKWKLKIESWNRVPTAAGLASSASGMAALAFALIKLYSLPWPTKEAIALARLGSGSACRSLFGGFVHWEDDGVKQLFSKEHWPQIGGFIVVLSDEMKSVSSTEGMRRTKETSALFPARISAVLPERIQRLQAALSHRNFSQLADITMRDSNCMHACCLDSLPPISYLSRDSFAVIEAVHEYNAIQEDLVLAYTFDAGPNAVIIAQDTRHLDQFRMRLLERFEGRAPRIINWKLGNGPESLE